MTQLWAEKCNQRPSNQNVIIRTQAYPPLCNICEMRVSSALTDSTRRSSSSHLIDVESASSHLMPCQHTRRGLGASEPSCWSQSCCLLMNLCASHKGIYFVPCVQCHHFLPARSRRGQFGVAHRSPRHEVMGHRSVCCVLLVKRSFIIISGHCLVMLIWHHVCNKGFV